jgi:hypothetical protein
MFEVLVTVITSTALWAVTPCSVLEVPRIRQASNGQADSACVSYYKVQELESVLLF